MPIKVNTLGTKIRSKKKSIKKESGQSRKRMRKRLIRTFILSAITVLFSTLLVAAFYIYKFMNAPFSSASDSVHASQDLWKNDTVNLLVMKVDDLNDDFSAVNFFSIVNIEPKNYRYKVYVFPLEDEITRPEFSYSEGQQKIVLKDIYAMGNANGGDTISNIEKMMLSNFAIGIDGYVIVDNDGFSKLNNRIGNIDFNDLSALLRLKNTLKLPMFINTFRSSAKTNLTFYDVAGFLKFIKSTSESSSYIRYLNKYALLDTDVWDQIWREKLNAEEIKREYTKILILNGSKDPKIPGLAKWGSRIVENMGGSILDMQNSFAEFNENTIIVSDLESETVKRLKQILESASVLSKDSLDKSQSYNPEIERADVTVVITSY